MNESQLQSQCVVYFSQNQLPGILWATGNRSLSMKDGISQKSRGLKRGIPDLFLFRNWKLIGIELKLKGSVHNKQHIEEQYNIGLELIKNGGEYYMLTSLDSFISLVQFRNVIDGCLTICDIAKLLETSKKTITF
ncbi:MAG: hypothetical protein US15_C0055G0006 [Candidatus Moranbacteria bacterium GW2011_GWF1_36_4]|nr:MAG: hypothetical protein US15_C0055G0006 [Candidatus Moranbacteria bacterium GW2011_GWF1_36_4]